MRMAARSLDVLASGMRTAGMVLAVLAGATLGRAVPGNGLRVGSPEHRAWVECLNAQPVGARPVPCPFEPTRTWDADRRDNGLMLGGAALASMILATLLGRAARRKRLVEETTQA